MKHEFKNNPKKLIIDIGWYQSPKAKKLDILSITMDGMTSIQLEMKI